MSPPHVHLIFHFTHTHIQLDHSLLTLFNMDDNATHDPSRLLSTRSLPSEILLKIFGMLTQGDCLRCMSVCRTWYKAIPQYTHQCFRSVMLKGNRGHADNTRLQKCLGSHVKSAVLDSCDTQAQLEALLTLLERYQCYDIRRLCKFSWALKKNDVSHYEHAAFKV